MVSKNSFTLLVVSRTTPFFAVLPLIFSMVVGLSHLREHKFRHNLNDTIDPFCLYGTSDLETSEHFLLRCPTYAYFRLKLFDNLRNNIIR